MAKAFTNAHAHIFTANHAPDYFLKTAISNITLAEWVDKLLQKDGTRWVSKRFLDVYKLFIGRDKQTTLRRYIEFIEIGTSATQTSIYQMLAKNYAKFGDFRIVVLTLVLDYLDLERSSNHIRIQTQVEDVCNIKRNALYQKNIYPFLGVDPRQTGIDLLDDWAKKYINIEKGFAGIKIYPAAGFFPFDIRLDKLWAWAEQNEVPVMAHCTRSGSFYLGTFDSILNRGILNIGVLNPDSSSMPSIYARIRNMVNDTAYHKKNDIWCNIFGHPENYKPVLDKYPKLKICLAHLGGRIEVVRSHPALQEKYKTLGDMYPDYLQDNWYELVIDLMKQYENVYSDISYTLYDEEALTRISKRFREPDMIDKFGRKLIGKLMYGTDFYLTQQEKTGMETNLENLFLKAFEKEEVDLIAYENTDRYLDSLINESK